MADKKLKLLTETERKGSVKKPTPAAAPAAAQPVFKQLPYEEPSGRASRWLFKSFLILLVLLLTALVVFPKPALLHYQKDGIATQSVYWNGFLHYPAVLLDSQLTPSVDSDRAELTLCDGNVVKDGQPTCTIYRIDKEEGMMAAWRYHREHH